MHHIITVDDKLSCQDLSARRVNRYCDRAGIAWLELLLALSMAALIAQLAWPAVDAWLRRPLPGKQRVAESQYYQYVIYLPQEYGAVEKKWPLLIYLHGSGTRGSDIQRVRHSGTAKYIDLGHHLPMVVVSPQCPANHNWEPEPLLALLDELTTRFDIGPVFVAGFSMGGFGTWQMAQAAPDRFTAVVPVSGGGNPDQADVLKELPIWAFHGGKDKMVPLKASQEMVDAIKDVNGNIKFTIFQKSGHSIGSKVFHDLTTYEWLLAQHKGEAGNE